MHRNSGESANSWNSVVDDSRVQSDQVGCFAGECLAGPESQSNPGIDQHIELVCVDGARHSAHRRQWRDLRTDPEDLAGVILDGNPCVIINLAR